MNMSFWLYLWHRQTEITIFNRNDLDKLIDLFKSLLDRDRIFEIIKLGRKEKTAPDVVTLIDDLQQRNYYELETNMAPGEDLSLSQ